MIGLFRVIGEWYVCVPHKKYVKTNYGWYPDTLLTRFVVAIQRRRLETEYDLLIWMLERFGVPLEILKKRGLLEDDEIELEDLELFKG